MPSAGLSYLFSCTIKQYPICKVARPSEILLGRALDRQLSASILSLRDLRTQKRFKNTNYDDKMLKENIW